MPIEMRRLGSSCGCFHSANFECRPLTAVPKKLLLRHIVISKVFVDLGTQHCSMVNEHSPCSFTLSMTT